MEDNISLIYTINIFLDVFNPFVSFTKYLVFQLHGPTVVEEMELGSNRLVIDKVDLMLQHLFLVERISKIRRLREYFD